MANRHSLNRELVATGMAWWYRRYAPGEAILAQLEAEAAKRGLGLNLVHPQCTSQYKTNRAMASGTTKTSA